jgi:hypothetical protein
MSWWKAVKHYGCRVGSKKEAVVIIRQSIVCSWNDWSIALEGGDTVEVGALGKG